MADEALHCLTCRYNLTGLSEQRCPECGEPFDPAEYAWHLERSQPPFSRSRIWFVSKPVIWIGLVQSVLIIAVNTMGHGVLAFLATYSPFVVVLWVASRAAQVPAQWAEDDRFVQSAKLPATRHYQKVGIIAAYTFIIGIAWTVLTFASLIWWGAQGTV